MPANSCVGPHTDDTGHVAVPLVPPLVPPTARASVAPRLQTTAPAFAAPRAEAEALPPSFLPPPLHVQHRLNAMDLALGCLLGVAVGDAAGAALEDQATRLLPCEAARAAMAMPGSQRPYLGRGQVTDDTELTICLARGE